MKPFRFRLETLLEFRKMQKEQSQIAFLKASKQLSIEKEVLGELEGKLTENLALFTTHQQRLLSIEVFKSYQYYFDKIKEEISKQRQRVKQAEEECQECLQLLREAEKNYEIVEKFREKKLEQYQIEMVNEEQKFLDEIGLQTYIRGK